jgi:hypothetical protein
MINLIVIVVSAMMLALLMGWWRWPAFRTWIEAPKHSMLRQERRFDDQNARTVRPDVPAAPHHSPAGASIR